MAASHPPAHAGPSLWLLRHAPPLIAPSVCYGRLDVAADAALTVQAAQEFATAYTVARSGGVAKNFSAPSGAPLAAAVLRYSPLQRCEQLQRALMAHNGDFALATHADPRLQEMDFGRWEGQPWDAIPRSEIDAWAAHLATYAPGGGESLVAMLQRVQIALQDSWAVDSQHGQSDVVWVTHAGVIRCVQWLLLHGDNLPTSARWNLPAPGCGQWLQLPWAPMAARLPPC